MKIFLHANFNTISGYGNTATNLAIELQNKNVDVYPIVKSIGFDMPEKFLNLLMKKYPIGKYIDFYINFDTPNNLKIPKNLKFIKNKIAFTMWEQTKLTKNFKKNDFVDYTSIFVPCEMNLEPFGEVFDKNKIKIIPLGVDTDFYAPFERDFFDETLKVCINGALTYRKGIDILTDVMLDEKIKKLPIEFYLKNSQRTVHPKISEVNPNIHVYEGVWDREKIKEFYNKCHVMICASRGEGFNQVAVEFLATGGVVITHNWGGHSTWVNSEYCKVIPYKLVKVTHWDDVQEDSKWAEVNKNDIISALIDLYYNREKLVTLSKNAVRMVELYSFENFAKKAIIYLEELNNGRN